MRYKQINSFRITLLIFSSIDLIGQSRCDTSSDEIFVFTDVPPKMDNSFDELEIIVNKEINLTKFKLEEKNLTFSFIINCNGEDFDHKTLNSKNMISIKF